MSNRSDTLRALADLLDEHPEVEMPYVDCWGDEITGIRFQLTSDGDQAAAKAAAVVKAFPGPFRKDWGDDSLTFRGEFAGAPVEVRTNRADVCVARQVGTKTVMKKDPEALKAVPEVEVEVPVYEYDCKPILGPLAA